MRYLLLLLILVLPACKNVEKQQEIKVHVITRNMDLSNLNERPGTAECGGTYSIKF